MPHEITETSPEKKPARNTPKNDYFELKIPKFVFQETPLSPLWVFLLLGITFLLGMQTARIRYMEQSFTRAETLAAQNATGTGTERDPNQPALGQKVDMGVGSLPVLGKKDAKVTIVEFSDFQCPFCKRFYDETYRQIIKDYIDTGKAKLAFRHLPLTDIHPNAVKAAEASECANEQGNFWEYHDILFEQFDSWINEPPESLPTKLTAMAEELKLNSQEFTNCVASSKYTKKVTDEMAQGQAAGATGTPSFFINGQLLVGALPYQTFKTILDQELKK